MLHFDDVINTVAGVSCHKMLKALRENGDRNSLPSGKMSFLSAKIDCYNFVDAYLQSEIYAVEVLINDTCCFTYFVCSANCNYTGLTAKKPVLCNMHTKIQLSTLLHRL